MGLPRFFGAPPIPRDASWALSVSRIEARRDSTSSRSFNRADTSSFAKLAAMRGIPSVNNNGFIEHTLLLISSLASPEKTQHWKEDTNERRKL
jgi:hypothetical protein